ncbi:Protein NAPE-2 a, partial [Aphelenchoides avenae]
MADRSYVIEDRPPVKMWKELVKLVVEGEGWLNSTHDYASWQEGFADENFHLFVAVDKENHTLVGAIGVASFENVRPEEDPLSVLGMFVVRPEYRGKAVGSALFQRALEQCMPNIFLFSAKTMTQKYADRYGFKEICDWQLETYAAKCSDVHLDGIPTDNTLTVADISDVGWEKIHAYDAAFAGGVDRKAYLEAFLKQCDSFSKVALKENGDVVGLCHIRVCHGNELCIGPFFADDEAIASTTLRGVLESVGDLPTYNSIYLKTPSTNGRAKTMFSELCGGKCALRASIVPQFTKKKLEKLPTDDVDSVDPDFAHPVLKNGKYSNPASFGYVRPSVPNVARFFLCEKNFSAIPTDPKILDDTLPVVKPNFESGADLAVTWIGHATVLVQMEGIAFITDPIWVLKASPFSFVGPGRYRPAPCAISELPELAFGMISHNHYDHLSDVDVRELSLRNPNMTWFVPAGLKSWMQSRMSGNPVHEMT